MGTTNGRPRSESKKYVEQYLSADLPTVGTNSFGWVGKCVGGWMCGVVSIGEEGWYWREWERGWDEVRCGAVGFGGVCVGVGERVSGWLCEVGWR